MVVLIFQGFGVRSPKDQVTRLRNVYGPSITGGNKGCIGGKRIGQGHPKGGLIGTAGVTVAKGVGELSPSTHWIWAIGHRE